MIDRATTKQEILEENNTQTIPLRNLSSNKNSFFKLPTFTFTTSSKNNAELNISPRKDINTTISQEIDIRINEWISEYFGTSMTSSMYIQADLQDAIEKDRKSVV